jgi:hypothetical protein
MSAVPKGYTLQAGDRANPVVWIVHTRVLGHRVDVSDTALEALVGEGKSRRLKSLGHGEGGAHFLITRGGTSLHTDKAYARYSHQLVLRNDGNRLRGLVDLPQSEWDTPLVRGVMYCLDTHSPHQGLPDPRMAPDRKAPMWKVVAAVDRMDEELSPAEAFSLLMPLLNTQLSEWENRKRPVRTH